MPTKRAMSRPVGLQKDNGSTTTQVDNGADNKKDNNADTKTHNNAGRLPALGSVVERHFRRLDHGHIAPTAEHLEAAAQLAHRKRSSTALDPEKQIFFCRTVQSYDT